MFVITQRPSKLIGDASENNESNWNAVGNPIVYIGQRRDFEVDTIQDNGGGVELVFTGVDLTLDLYVGLIAYFESDTVYQGRTIEIVNSAFAGGDTTVNIVEYPSNSDVPFVSSDIGGFLNTPDRENYRIEYQVFRSSDDAELDSVVFEAGDSPGVFQQVDISNLAIVQAGIVYLNVSPIIRPYLDANFEGDLTESNETFDDDNAYVGFYIKYQEVWNGDSETLVDDVANQFFALMGARQIPSPNGGNMGEYVTFADGAPLASFVTKYSRPKVWRGFPFLISVIVGDLGSLSVLNVNYLDADGNSVGTDNSDNVPDVDGAFYSFDITKILAIPDDAKTVVLRYVALTGVVEVIEEFECDVVDTCENPIMLIARNSLGGIFQWVFDGNTERTFDYGNDLKASRRVLFAEDITENEWNALQDFIKLGEVYKDNIVELLATTNKTSTRIGHQVYTVDEDGNKLGVLVIPTRNRTETRQRKHKFELEIEYPEEFTP